MLNDHTDDVLFIDGKMHKLDITMIEKVNASTWTLKTLEKGDRKFKNTKVELTFTIEDVRVLC